LDTSVTAHLRRQGQRDRQNRESLSPAGRPAPAGSVVQLDANGAAQIVDWDGSPGACESSEVVKVAQGIRAK
jgi:hypothetical protein